MSPTFWSSCSACSDRNACYLQVATLMGHYRALKSRVTSYHSQLLAALEPAGTEDAAMTVA